MRLARKTGKSSVREKSIKNDGGRNDKEMKKSLPNSTASRRKGVAGAPQSPTPEGVQYQAVPMDGAPVRRRLLLGAALAAPFIATAPRGARADKYPSRSIRVILPGPAGGIIDVAGRAIADSMQKELGQLWMIDPRPGANGIVAGQALLAAPADGYTLYLTVSGHVVLNLLLKAPFDAMADFKPIAMIGVNATLLCVPPTSPVNTVAEFVEYAKKNPGKLNYLNSGNGTSTHLIPELLKIKYGIDITSIFYKGWPPGVQDLLAGRLDIGVVAATLALPQITAGKLKAIATIGPERLKEAPNVPTLTELGLSDIEIRSSIPLMGRTDLPDAIVTRLNEAVGASLADPETRKRLDITYIQPTPMTPAATASALQSEHQKLASLIKRLGIKAEG